MTFPTKLARALLTVAVVAAAAPVAAANSPDMARLKAHIGDVHTMTASFVQTDARGRSSAGKMDLQRPGKVRFEYGSGDLLLVSNGKTLTLIDYQVGQKSSWPLNRTPLGVLLSNSPDLKGRAQIVPSPEPNVVSVRARDPSQYGSLTLVFLRSGSAPGGFSSMAGPPSTDRIGARRSSCRMSVTMSRYPPARSSMPSRRKNRM